MGRPRIHDCETKIVSVNLPVNVLDHTGYASFSEMVLAALTLLRQSNPVSGGEKKSLFNEELRQRMKDFFKTVALSTSGEPLYKRRFFYHYPDTNEVEYMQIVSDEIFKEEHGEKGD